MQSPVGKIIAIDTAQATVEVARTVSCARCASGRGCGAGLVAGAASPARLSIALPPGSDLRVGDTVVLALAGSRLFRATLLVYGMPLAGLVLGPAAGWLLVGPAGDFAAVLWAAGGLAAGVAAGRRYLRRDRCLREFSPVIEGRASGTA